jgi:hypothetical protein
MRMNQVLRKDKESPAVIMRRRYDPRQAFSPDDPGQD